MAENIRTYRPGDEETIAGLLRKCFETYSSYGLDGSKWLELAKLNEGFKLEGAYLLEVDGKPVSHVQVVEKKLRTSAGFLNTAGIANVATDPEHRGKGYASRLLSKAMEDYRRRGFPLTALFTGYASGPQRIYRRLGYVDVCLDDWWVAPLWDAQGSAREVRWIEVREAEERDIERVMRVYETSGNLYTGWPVRSESECREKMFVRTAYHGFFYVPRSPGDFVVAEEGGEVVGYAVAAKMPWDPEGFGIAELVALPGRVDALQALFTHIVKSASEKGARYLRAPRVPGADYARVFSSFGEQRGGGVFMSEILDFKALLESAATQKTAFLDRLAIKLKYRGESATISVKEGRAEVGEDSVDAVVDLDPETFNRFLFGYSSAEKLLLNSIVKADVPAKRILRLLNELFSPKPMHIWLIDRW